MVRTHELSSRGADSGPDARGNYFRKKESIITGSDKSSTQSLPL